MQGNEVGQRRSRLFTVRIWSEAVGNGLEHRGSARDVESGAFRNFRDWADLTSFLAARMDEEGGEMDRETSRRSPE